MELNQEQFSEEVNNKYAFDRNTFSCISKDDDKDRIKTEIGDEKQADFLPQVKIQRWDNEVNFSARLVHNEFNTTVETLEDKIVWKGDKVEAHFYEKSVSSELPEGGYEFEAILKEKPKTNVVEFTLNTKGLDFFYQPALTQEEMDKEGVIFIPENVIGSYAVYTSEEKINWEGKKEYKTGKVGHIYRPEIIDAKGTKVWGELDINNGILSIIIPQDFLDKAVYPVIVDPTFGYDTIGVTSLGISDTISGSPFTTVGAITSNFLRMYIEAGAGGNLKTAIYDASYNLIVSSNELTSITANSWNTTTYSAEQDLSATTQYYFFGWSDGGGIPYSRGDNTGAGSGRYKFLAYGAWPDPLTTVTSSSYKRSIYVVYATETATTIRYDFPGTYSWQAPVGVNSVNVHCWGGGGSGRSGSGSGDGGSGGGGGAYAYDVVSVTPGNSYTVVVGEGGIGSGTINTNGTAGDDSSFNTTSVVAKGGSGGTTSGGAGGLASASTGSVKYNGGTGGNEGANDYGGGGGGAGGPDGAGNNGEAGSATTGAGGSGDAGSGGAGGTRFGGDGASNDKGGGGAGGDDSSLNAVAGKPAGGGGGSYGGYGVNTAASGGVYLTWSAGGGGGGGSASSGYPNLLLMGVG